MDTHDSPAGFVNAAIRDRYDVVIAGARVAGASTAMLLARAGLRVLVVDPLPRGRDTLSTHALMRAGVMQLHRWGLLDEVRAAGTPRVRTTSFHYEDERIDIPIKPADGIDGLYAPRRTVLDPILARAAERAGVTIVHGAALASLLRGHGDIVRGAIIRDTDGQLRSVAADLVIGADGTHSKVARLVGARTVLAMTHSAAILYGYESGLGINDYEWYFGPRIAAGVIPTNDGEAVVFASMPEDRFTQTPHAALGELHRAVTRPLMSRLGIADEQHRGPTRLRAFAGLPGYVRESAGPGWALVGDAGVFRDPITAHGITDALRDAEFLARAVLSGDSSAFRHYEADRNDRVMAILEITDRVSSFDWSVEEIKELHLELSRAMNVSVQAIRELDVIDAAPVAVMAGGAPA